jgi:hypothetical protein
MPFRRKKGKERREWKEKEDMLELPSCSSILPFLPD